MVLSAACVFVAGLNLAQGAIDSQPDTTTAADSVVTFNEILYHPADDNPALEWVELYNPMSVALDLTDWRIEGGIDFRFPAGTVFAPNSFLVVAAEPAALQAATGLTGVYGPFAKRLSNGGDTLRLRNNSGRLMDEVSYRDEEPWPVAADGSGASLAKRGRFHASSPAANWRASAQAGGTPGAPNFPALESPAPQAEWLLASSASARWQVPRDGSLGGTWTAVEFDDSGWMSGRASAGFESTVSAPTELVNVALGHPVIDGSGAYFNNAYNVADGSGNFTAQNVTDGSVVDTFGVSYWLGREGRTNEYFTVDLGKSVLVEQIRLRNTHNTQYNDRGTAAFQIYAAESVDSRNGLVNPQLVLAGTLRNVASLSPIPADAFTPTNGLTSTNARYLKFVALTANNPGNHVGLNEIEVYAREVVGIARAYSWDGTRADVSGHGSDAQDYGTQFSPSVPAAVGAGQSLEFDGAGGHVRVPDSRSPSAYTLAMWVSVDAVRQSSLLVRTDVNGPLSSWSHQLRINSAGRFEHYLFDGSSRTLTATNVIQPGVWYHVAATAQSGGPMQIYVNGVSSGGTATLGSLWSGGDQWRFGTDSAQATNYFRGRLDEVGIWHVALGAGDIARLAAGARPALLNGYRGTFETDVQAALFRTNSSLFLRVPLPVDPGAVYETLTLRVRYNDGFVAYLNGVEVARRNAPAALAWDSAAATRRPDLEALITESIDLSAAATLLRAGRNLLALHALNAAAEDSNFLISAELSARQARPVLPHTDLALHEVAAATSPEFFVELINYGTAGQSLDGLRIRSSNGGTYTFWPEVLGPGGHLALDTNQLGFSAAAGDRLFLLGADGAVLDGARVTARLRGRHPAAPQGDWWHPAVATPGEANQVVQHDEVVINEILYHAMPLHATNGFPPVLTTNWLAAPNARWRYEQSGTNLGTAWVEPAYEDANWPSGSATLARATGLPTTIRTTLATNNQVTYYFRTGFNVTNLPAGSFGLLRLLIDDGAIVYINGTEFYRQNLPAGPVDYLTPALTNVGTAAFTASLVVPLTNFVLGSNFLAVEAHQHAAGMNDVVMGGDLSFVAVVVPGAPSRPFTEVDEQWVELYNRSASPVDLGGWQLDGGIRYTFPSNTLLAADAYLVVANNAAALRAKYPDIAVFGDFQGQLSHRGERVVLRDAEENLACAVTYYDSHPWPACADGGGSSLELRDPRADPAAPESWAASVESDRTAWRRYSYRARAIDPVYSPGMYSFYEFRLGLLDAGEALLDNITVRELPPAPSPRQLLQNTNFTAGADKWRFLGNHSRSRVEPNPDDPANRVLHVVATGPTSYLDNRLETTFKVAGAFVPIIAGRDYEIAFDAKWLAGSPQVHTELYYNKVAATTILDTPDRCGTPGRRNSSWVTNAGPTLTALRHSPLLPTPDEVIRVSVQSSDPDGIGGLTLHYAVNDGAWQTTPMVAAPGLAADFTATLAPQPAGAVIQFYVEATDALGAAAIYPAGGRDSRALLQVDSARVDPARQTFRLAMTSADAALLHAFTNLMSDDWLGCTVVHNEDEVFYDARVRLHGSMFSRPTASTTGFTVSFPSDHLFRGSRASVIVRRRGMVENFLKHIVNHAGGLPGNCDDIVWLVSHRADNVGAARLILANYDDTYVDSHFEGDRNGTVFKLEGIREYQATHDNTPEGYKLPQPIGWIQTYDIANLGDSPEQYRWSVLIQSQRARDDYSRVVAMGKAFSLTNGLEAAAAAAIDVDEWARLFALQTLTGIGDVYTVDNPHNLAFYARPDDGRMVALQNDWEFAFSRAANASIYGDKNLSRILNLPVYRRLYQGHLLDLMNTVYHSAYLASWAQHYSDVSGENYSAAPAYADARSAAVRAQLAAPVAFSITSGGGSNVTVNTPSVVLEGLGWIDVRELRHAGDTNALAVTWLDDRRWQVILPLQAGTNEIQLAAFDYRGAAVGQDSITVITTASEFPQRDYLRITELMYHPPPPTAAELAAQLTDPEAFEFVELINMGPVEVALQGVRFTVGIQFDFSTGSVATLAPRQRLLVVSDRAGFEFRYGPGFRVAGVYTGSLRNSGELIRLVDASGAVIQEFTYGDGNGWPEASDGLGSSLEAIHWSARPDLPTDWQASLLDGGTPGQRGVIRPGQVVIRAAAGRVELGFEAVVEQTYTVYRSETLTGASWQVITNLPAGDAARVETISDSPPPTSRTWFYRVATP